MKNLIIIILMFLSIIYLVNPTLGLIEILPDNIPFVGNIDEGLASYILLSCIEYLSGRSVGLFKRKNN